MNAEVPDGSDVRIIPSIAGGSANLSPEEFIRYSRHLSLPEVGIEGQKKIKSAKILVVGAGGLGSPVSLYLAAAGVGTIGMVDFDVVDESNLQRQVLFGMEQIGKSKLQSAEERLKNLNPYTKINLHEVALSSENALDIIKNYDIVVDGTDNFPTRYLVNDACVILGKPNVYGSIYRFDGQVSVFNYDSGPCYRCLYPSPPPPNLVPSCAEGGVLGVLPGIIGTMQANETLKLILGIGEPMVNRFLLFDALTFEFSELKIQKNDACVVCSDNPSVTNLIDYKQFCGVDSVTHKIDYEEMEVTELDKLLKNGSSPTIIDVREEFELEISKIDGARHIPMNQVPKRLDELNAETDYVIICRTGVRSAQICEFLANQNFKSVTNLTGGINEWAKKIDSSLPIY
jgi:adenylyltransferase/sulfurtransferase